MRSRILVVDDDRKIADSLCSILELAGHEAMATYAAEEALELVGVLQPNLVIADVVMPGKTGIELASELRNTHPQIPLILLSGNAGTEELLNQAGSQIDGVLVLAKPFPPRDLVRIVDKITTPGSNLVA